ncbi:glycosyltransferase involved in cell wall biosynthesis [Algoriphagus ratkowskyi]|uniref:Glycosyltransferase family 4 protein n=1 Tax=Algoriphagus ratkowskyi TaxID=57028 RepID=A0A2W7QMV0_9BACT|nr:glycosyltransferase family 4 protein [Algoriphagus ratkowskyi]PZX49808.1 glycosyltransferase involved in cell wall biosynthesis [Algoriphagus ratkowskyi]TXD75472.1 glycosyltransferase family 4 protein [Algoriphagus ratkowskyi]
MKILQLIQKPQLRGAEVFAAQLSDQLIQRGHELMLVSLFDGTATLPFAGKQFCIAANSAKRFWDFTAWKKLATLIEEFQPDIIQANAGDTLKYAVSSKLAFGWKAKLVFRNANLISAFHKSIFQKRYNRFLMRQVDGVASVSELCKADFLITFDFPKTKIATLPIGVNSPEVKPTLPEDIAQVLEGSLFLIHIGSFVPEKNHEGLIRIFKHIQLVYPDVKLLLVGEGKLKKQLEEVHSTDPSIVFAGIRTDVPAILPFAKALLLPSLIEGLPGVILEAMINGVPVVAYDVGGISEVIISGETGYLISVKKEEMFIRAVEEILEGKTLELNGMIDSAKKQILETYSLPTITSKFEAFYQQLLELK